MSISEGGAMEALNAIHDEHPELAQEWADTVLATPPASTPLIHAAMIKAMRAIGAVTKSQEYSGGGARYNFRGIDAVVNATGPALRDAGVFILPEVLESRRADTWTGANKTQSKETFVRVRYTFMAEDGSSVSATVEGESLDTSDKGLAKATSVALRIVLLQTFQIPTGDPDPDSQHLERSGAGQMTEPLKKWLRAGIQKAAVSRLAELWWMVNQHAAMEQTAIEGESGRITWYGLMRNRLNEELERCTTQDACRELHGALGNAREVTVSPQVTMSDAIKARMEKLAAEMVQRENQFASRIAASTTVEEVGTILAEISEAMEAGLLTEEKATNVVAFGVERQEKLASQPKPEHAEGFDGPIGDGPQGPSGGPDDHLTEGDAQAWGEFGGKG